MVERTQRIGDGARDTPGFSLSAEAQTVVEKAEHRGYDVRWQADGVLAFSKEGGGVVYRRSNSDVLQLEKWLLGAAPLPAEGARRLESRVETQLAAHNITKPERQKIELVKGFRDLTLLTRVLQCLLATLIAVNVVAFLFDIAQYQLINSTFTQDEATANDTRQRIVGIIYLMTFVVVAAVFGRWIYRANRNARALGASGMEFTPGWSVGWYFVPFANFWKPFQAMREIWRASKNPVHWQNEPTDPILGWWWFAWVSSSILGQIYFRVLMAADDLSSLSAATVLGLIDEGSNVFSASLAFVLIRRLRLIQMARHAEE